MMKTQRQRTLLALRLYAEEATLWWLLGFEEDSQGQRAAEQIGELLIAHWQVAWTPPA